MQNCPNHILISYIVQSVFFLVFKLYRLCRLFCKELTWLFSYSKSNCRNCQKVVILQKLSESGYIVKLVTTGQTHYNKMFWAENVPSS